MRKLQRNKMMKWTNLDSINQCYYFKTQLLLYCALLSRYYLVDAFSLFVDVGFIRLSKTLQKKKNIQDFLLPKDSPQQSITPQSL